MKRIIFLAMSLCFLAGSASAATPEETLKLLILGNQKAREAGAFLAAIAREVHTSGRPTQIGRASCRERV